MVKKRKDKQSAENTRPEYVKKLRKSILYSLRPVKAGKETTQIANKDNRQSQYQVPSEIRYPLICAECPQMKSNVKHTKPNAADNTDITY